MGPIVGWIRDFTQSYVIFIHATQFYIILCVVPWLIEIIWSKMKSRKGKK